MTAGPFADQQIVVTRTRTQASSLSARLADLGATPIEVPLIQIEDPLDSGAALTAAVARLDEYAWIAVSSPNGARRLVTAANGRSPRANVAVVGPATGRVLESAGWPVDLVASRHVAEGLVADFPEGEGVVLLPLAEIARDILAEGLRAKGWSPETVTAYRTVPAPVSAESRAAIASADIITFTSSSTVENFCAVVGRESLPPTVACIGPVTAATAEQLDITPTVIADVHTIDGLVDALVAHCAG